MFDLNRRFRWISVGAFSFIFAYLLSFLFEGQILYELIDMIGKDSGFYITVAIVSHFLGLFTAGRIIRSPIMAKRFFVGGTLICFAAGVPFFFSASPIVRFWTALLAVSGFVAGCMVASWGYFLKAYTLKNERIKSCADVLILSNILMIGINYITVNFSVKTGLMLSLFCLVPGAVLMWLLPAEQIVVWSDHYEKKLPGEIKKPMVMLFVFVSVITINSGLMYQVINPAFEHLQRLTSWYWALPYITALLIMRNLPIKAKRSLILYVGMGMIMASFLGFMLLDRNPADYIFVDTLMLGACGVLDLFWWSIIGEMLEYADNPVRIFGVGLSANVFGVLAGGSLGSGITEINLPEEQIAAIAFAVVSITLVLLPTLNRDLYMLLKGHVYLSVYKDMPANEQAGVIYNVRSLDPITDRERDVLQQMLDGKSNKAIAEALYISESTVKTHARNIYSKYDVSGRAELISTILKNQADV